MKRAFRLCAVLVVLTCSLTVVRPAAAYSACGSTSDTYCNQFCLQSVGAPGFCYKGSCVCY